MKKQVNIRLDDSSIERLDILCSEMEMTRTDVIEFLLNEYDKVKSNAISSEVVSSLLHQLEEKDKQLQEKDGQINQLLEQSRNYQVLLKQEQDTQLLLMKPKKSSWFRRLFGSPDMDNSESVD